MAVLCVKITVVRLRRHIMAFLILMLLILCGVSTASAQRFKVQLLEEGTEFTQFTGGWQWDMRLRIGSGKAMVEGDVLSF